MTNGLRAQKVSIDTPKAHSEPWVSVMVQAIEIDTDGKTITQVVDRIEQVYRRLSDVAAEVETIADPVTGQNFNASAAGIAAAIRAFVYRWIIEDCQARGIACHVNEHGRIVIEEH